MSVQLEINRSAARRLQERLQGLGLALPVFLSWKQALEFLLAENPSESLKFVQSRRDSFHEYQSTETVGNRTFAVSWEIEWDRSEDRFHVLEINVRELPDDLMSKL